METFFNQNLGIDLPPDELSYSQILLRTVVMFFAMLLMMRLAGLRFLAGKTTFDVLLGFILASMLSRAINGPAPFWGTILSGFLVVVLHRILAFLTCRYHFLGRWLKGRPEPLVVDGMIQEDAMAANQVSKHDLMQDLRLNSSVDDVEQVKLALLERNGEISVQCRAVSEKSAVGKQPVNKCPS